MACLQEERQAEKYQALGIFTTSDVAAVYLDRVSWVFGAQERPFVAILAAFAAVQVDVVVYFAAS
jgi:hypothetical protein